MFEVLAFVYESHDAGQTWPKPAELESKLRGLGFESDEIGEALHWLEGLEGASDPEPLEPWLIQPHPNSMRVYPRHEYLQIGAAGIGFISFLESAGVLPARMREVVIERAMAVPSGPLSLDGLKIIILLVYWRFGQEPDALILDELCGHGGQRVAH